MATQTFNVSFPKKLVQQMDQKAREQFGSRSDLLRHAVLKYLREEKEFEELLKYGKTIGAQNGKQSYEEIAQGFTEQRREKRQWKPADFKNRI